MSYFGILCYTVAFSSLQLDHTYLHLQKQIHTQEQPLPKQTLLTKTKTITDYTNLIVGLNRRVAVKGLCITLPTGN